MAETSTSRSELAALRGLHRALGWEKIRAIIADFYGRASHDPRLAPFFAHVVDLHETADSIARFWWRDLGGDPIIAGEIFNPHDVHRHFGVTAQAVDDWLRIFQATLRDHLPAEQADLWLARAEKFGGWTRAEMAKQPPAGGLAQRRSDR